MSNYGDQCCDRLQTLIVAPALSPANVATDNYCFSVFATAMDFSTVNELLAGSVGGAAQVLVGQPLDTIKTRAQVAPSSVFLPACAYDGTLLIISMCSCRRHVCELSAWYLFPSIMT